MNLNLTDAEKNEGVRISHNVNTYEATMPGGAVVMKCMDLDMLIGSLTWAGINRIIVPAAITDYWNSRKGA
jgi:hypothetical protein